MVMADSGKDQRTTRQPPTAPDRDSLRRSLEVADVGVLAQDRSLVYLWTENPPRKWSNGSLVGRRDDDFLPAGVAGDLDRLKREVMERGVRRHCQIEIPGADGAGWYQLWLDPSRDADGAVSGVVTTVTEITDQRQREQTLRTLLREVSHRSKNLLAIIQSIAAQTGRYSETIDEFLVRFRGRLQSLSASQDLVTSSNWRGADLSQLVTGQVARYCEDPSHNLVLRGENPYLNPNAALHVGLALHELAVNSVSYGALSQPGGQVSIEVSPRGGGKMELVWREPLARSGPEAEKRHFGTVALERVVPMSVNGSASLVTENGILTYSLLLPAESFHAD
jgi:two-component sensor histidine kinase